MSATVTIMVSSHNTRLLVTQGPDELMRAVLPPNDHVRYSNAAPLLLQGIACWLDTSLEVVLSAAGQQLSSCLGLTDVFGIAESSVYYTVKAVDRDVKRPRPRRLGGLGDFRQLHLFRRQNQNVAEGGAR